MTQPETPQIRLHFSADKQRAEELFSVLEVHLEEDGFPVSIVEIDEAARIFEVSIYVIGDQSAIDEVAARIGEVVGKTDLQRESVPDIDWVTKTLEGLAPVRAGRFLVHGGHDRNAVKANDLAIEIEAGRAFGTGHHGTTAGCLTMLETVIARRKPQRSLDLGAGSAVLAIAIAMLAKTPVLATDIDPVAVDVARRNVRLNHVHGLVRCETATGFLHPAFNEAGPFDLIVANILPTPLMRMAPDIARYLAPEGDVILSGILTTQRRRVISAFALQGLSHCRTITRGDWVTLHLRRATRPS